MAARKGSKKTLKPKSPVWTHEFLAPNPDMKGQWMRRVNAHLTKGEAVIVDEQVPALVDDQPCIRYRYHLQLVLPPLGLGTK